MRYRKDTTFDQLHAFWLRLWDFARDRMHTLDGSEVQDALLASASLEHPFWRKLGEAFDELCHKLSLCLNEARWDLQPGDRSDQQVLESLRAVAEKSGFLLDPDLHRSIDPAGTLQAMTSVGFLHFNQKLSVEKAYQAVKARGFRFAPPSLAVRMAEEHCSSFRGRDFERIVGCPGLCVFFIDEERLDRTVMIMPRESNSNFVTGCIGDRVLHCAVAVIREK